MIQNSQFDVQPGAAMPIEVQNFLNTSPEYHWSWSGFGQESIAGVRVNEATALSHIPYWQANCIIAGDMGVLPLILKRRRSDGRCEPMPNHPSMRAISQPNELTNTSIWAETQQKDTLGWGNGLSAINRDGAGRPIGFTRLLPQPDYTQLRKRNGRWSYFSHTITDQGQVEELPPLDPVDVFHTKWLSPDGLWGYTFLSLLRDSLGHGVALQQHGSYVFRNRARPDVILTYPGRVSEETQAEIRANWSAQHGGLSNTARVGVADMSATITTLPMSNEDAEFLKSRQFDVQDWSRAFSIPQWMMGAQDRPTFASVNENFLWYKTHTLMRHATVREQEADRKLLTDAERNRFVRTKKGFEREFFFTHDWEVFSLADFSARAQAITSLVGGAILDRDEGREMFGRNPAREDQIFLSRSTGEPVKEDAEEDSEDTSEDAPVMPQSQSDRFKENGNATAHA